MDQKNNLTFKIHDVAPEWWDSKTSEAHGTFCSSSMWTKFHEHHNIGKGKFLEVSENGKPILLITIYEMLIGGYFLLTLPKFIKIILNKFNFLKSYTFHLQPQILKNDLQSPAQLVNVSLEIFEYLDALSNKNGVNIFPADYICFKNLDDAKTLLHKTKIKNVELLGTTRLKLISEAENYKILEYNTRNKISKAQRDQVIVKIAESKEDITNFYNALKNSWKGYGLSINNLEYYTSLQGMFPDNIKIFISMHNQNIIAGSGVMVFGKVMMEFSMFVSDYCRKNKIAGGDLIKWEIIKYGLRNNLEYFDLNMIGVPSNEDDQLTDKIKKINDYKLKWGGEIIYGVKIEKLNNKLKLVKKIKQKILGH